MDKIIGGATLNNEYHTFYWNDETHEIKEGNSYTDVVIGYADTEDAAIDYLFATIER